MSDAMNILVIGAHPADVFDQSGGTMAHHAARGDHVACVVLTHGGRIHDKVVSDEMFGRQSVPRGEELEQLIQGRATVKGLEVREACQLLGVGDLEIWSEDDAVLLVESTLVRRVARIIRKKKPEVILTHFPKEDGGVCSPHATCGQIVMHAIELAAQVGGDDGRPPHKIAQTFFFGGGAAAVRGHLWSGAGGFYNDVFIDIGDVIEKKLAALDMLDSQGYAGAYARKRIETCDGAFGDMAGVSYAEGFISLRSITSYYLPVSDINLELAKLSDHQALARRSQKYDAEANLQSTIADGY